MIICNPNGAPDLACDECGCRWYDRQTNSCYECGTPVPDAELEKYLRALRDFQTERGIVVDPPAQM